MPDPDEASSLTSADPADRNDPASPADPPDPAAQSGSASPEDPAAEPGAAADLTSSAPGDSVADGAALGGEAVDVLPALVQLAVAGVGLSSTWADPPSATVGLEPVNGGERIEIIMSRVDGQFLNEALEVGAPPRPRSHDLLLEAVRALNGEVTAATLTEKRAGGIYVAELSIRRPDGSIARLDARPSDAINVALRSPSASLWATEAVLASNSPVGAVAMPWNPAVPAAAIPSATEIVLASSTEPVPSAEPPDSSGTDGRQADRPDDRS